MRQPSMAATPWVRAAAARVLCALALALPGCWVIPPKVLTTPDNPVPVAKHFPLALLAEPIQLRKGYIHTTQAFMIKKPSERWAVAIGFVRTDTNRPIKDKENENYDLCWIRSPGDGIGSTSCDKSITPGFDVTWELLQEDGRVIARFRLDNVNYYGFAPSTPGDPHGAGKVGEGLTTHTVGDRDNSHAGYIDDVGWSKSISIGSKQYDAMKKSVDVWKAADHTYNGLATLGGENCTTFVQSVLKAGHVTELTTSRTSLPINLIPADERRGLFITGPDGQRSPSDALKDPLHTPGTPAYEYKQSNPGLFETPPNSTPTQDRTHSELRLNSDGTFTEIVRGVGADGRDTQTNEYNAAGVVTRSTQVDGAGDDADYASRTTAYDIQGRIDSIDVRRDDGTRDSTDHDQNSTQAWSRVESHFDTQDRQDHATAFIDDGSWSFYDYDQTNARGDRTWQAHVDAQGRTDWTNVIQDDGSVDFTDYDQTNVRADSIFQNRTDAWGRQDWVNIIQDDGSRDWTDYDQAGSQGWSAVASHFDARGREDFANVYLDDGSRDQHDYDQDGSQGWHAVVSHFDAWGREAHASMYRDDGSRDWLDYDENGSQGWNRVESHFDALGREAHASMFLDDGSRDWYDYDQDGSQGWGALVSHFDASGREAHANLYMDDGSRNWYDYDQDGSQAWSRVQSRFDAWGREDEATMLLDDGRRKRYDYDQDNTQYWSRVEQDFDVFGRETIANVYQDDGGRTQIDYTVQAGYRVVSRFNAQGYKILEETSAWLPGGPLPAPLAPAVGPVPMSPFYVPPNAAPLNPFVPSPFAPFYFQEPPVPAPAPEWDLEVDVRIPEPEPYV